MCKWLKVIEGLFFETFEKHVTNGIVCDWLTIEFMDVYDIKYDHKKTR